MTPMTMPPKNIDRENDEPGDRVAADELRCAVHRAEKCTFLLELAPARLRHLLINEAGREVRVDRHLLAGNGVEGETRPDLGDARCALGDNQEVVFRQSPESTGIAEVCGLPRGVFVSPGWMLDQAPEKD